MQSCAEMALKIGEKAGKTKIMFRMMLSIIPSRDKNSLVA
jgi:hypothetical protein